MAHKTYHQQTGFWRRLLAVMSKEFTQMRRDRMTIAMLVAIPVIQIVLFGYAINTNPKHLPTAILVADHSAYSRAFIQGVKNTDYFRVIAEPNSERAASRLLQENKALFVISIPADFSQRLVRGQEPHILLEADGTDGVAISGAMAAIETMANSVLTPLLRGPLAHLQAPLPTVQIIVHAQYNPENMTSYNIVPGLLGVILTMTMVMITSQAITREYEEGNMEYLLATPLKPLEVMIGKMTPFIIIGYIQMVLILLMAFYLFHVPILGNLAVLFVATLPFICANLAMGLTFSTLAKTQIQAVQMTFFFFLPSILLSGFMFPFWGMPVWATWLGQVLPLTHFLRITRGVMLKGSGYSQIWTDLWPILIFMLLAIVVAVKRYRQTLD